MINYGIDIKKRLEETGTNMKILKSEIAVSRIIPLDILIILIWTIVAFLFTITSNDSIIRTILGIPTVLFIPGYILLAVLFPKKDDLGNIERISLSLGSSIIVISIIGLILNFTFGIKLIPMLIVLYLYTIILGIVTIHRRERLSEEQRFSVSFHNIKNRTNMSSTDKILTIALLVMISIASSMIYYTLTVPKIGERFTEFYILDSTGKMNYGTNLKINNPVNYQIGIINHEYTTMNYTIKTLLGGDTLTTKELTLGHNDVWQNDITIIPHKSGNDMELKFQLFKDNNFTQPYRELYLWIDSIN